MDLSFQYKCSECGKTTPITPETMLCSLCSKMQKQNEPLRGILEVEVNNPRQIQLDKSFDLFTLLPVEKKFFPAIPVGQTPLWEPEKLRKQLNEPNLYIKDDGLNPTGSLKDRASYLVAAFARKHGIKEIVLASTGNAGSSMAGIGAAADLRITLFLPQSAPKAKICQAMQFGANLILVNGNYDKAYDLSMEYSQKFKCLSRNTAHNPLTIEGKKTVSLEITQQLGRAPDSVFVSVGDGVIIAGIYKGFTDLKKLGIIAKTPKIYGIQAEGSDALWRAYHKGFFENIPTQTIADSISVDIPRNGYCALKKIKEHGGELLKVSDAEILKAQSYLAANTGHFTEPAGATAFAGFLKVRSQLDKNQSTVIITTGNGLKDIESALKGVTLPHKAINSLADL